jgi:hypothetical protein
VDIKNGQLIWRFRGAPVESLIMNNGRLESPWPIHGSVLVVNGTVYFAAGRSSFIDGGIHIFGINALTGEKLYHVVEKGEAPTPNPAMMKNAETSRAKSRSGGAGSPAGTAKGKKKKAKKNRKKKVSSTTTPKGLLVDLLLSNGESIKIQSFGYSLELEGRGRSKLMTASFNFLSDSWMHRANWTLGGGVNYKSPFGKLIVFDEGTAFGVQNQYTWRKYSSWLWPQDHSGHHHQKYARYTPKMFPSGVRLYAQENRKVHAEVKVPDPENIPKKYRNIKNKWAKPEMSSPAGHKWTRNLPLQIRAMVLTEKVLFAAGWKDFIMTSSGKAQKDTAEPVLIAFDRETGKQIADYKLPAKPVFDGMIAARGRLFLSLQNGEVICFSK